MSELTFYTCPGCRTFLYLDPTQYVVSCRACSYEDDEEAYLAEYH